jgi:hypothetical protein
MNNIHDPLLLPIHLEKSPSLPAYPSTTVYSKVDVEDKKRFKTSIVTDTLANNVCRPDGPSTSKEPTPASLQDNLPTSTSIGVLKRCTTDNVFCLANTGRILNQNNIIGRFAIQTFS